MATYTPQIVYKNNGLHIADISERQRMSWELDVAPQVQARLFPSEQRSYPGLEYFGTGARPMASAEITWIISSWPAEIWESPLATSPAKVSRRLC